MCPFLAGVASNTPCRIRVRMPATLSMVYVEGIYYIAAYHWMPVERCWARSVVDAVVNRAPTNRFLYAEIYSGRNRSDRSKSRAADRRINDLVPNVSGAWVVINADARKKSLHAEEYTTCDSCSRDHFLGSR